MRNVYIYCEGPTEESFINEILTPYFLNYDILVYPIVCTTKRTTIRKFRGGVCDYNKIKNEIIILCKSHKHEHITTMFDYYGMPSNTPMIDCTDVDLYRRIGLIEEAINNDIGQQNCSFNLSLHEFEGLLFSSPQSFQIIADNVVVQQIEKIRDENISPEYINKSPETAPSKRLEMLIPNYAKIRNGTILAKDMGLDSIITECRHFSEWINRIKAFAE